MDDASRDLPPAEPRGPAITIDFEGRAIRAFEGEPVALALLAAGVRVLARSPKYHRPRGAFCFEGHCASCYVRIDGTPNRRACMTPARPGLRCERQNAFPDADLDLLRAADWLFPRGMDHHRLMTGSRLGNDLFVKLVRQMGGSGILPDEPPAALPAVERQSVDVCIVGGGPAGLSAACALAHARPALRVLLVDEQDRPGGALLAEPEGLTRGQALADAARRAGAHLWQSATAIAYYPEDRDAPPEHDGLPGVLAVVTRERLVRITARRIVYTTGAYDQNLPFPDNDRPGVLSARGCGRLAFRWGVCPSERVLVITDRESQDRFPFIAVLTHGLERCGVPVRTARLDENPKLDLAHELVAVAALPAPASELARQHGACVTLDPTMGGFAVDIDPEFETTAPGVFAAGDVTGFVGPEAAAAAGLAAGRTLARRF